MNKNVQGHIFALTANILWGLMAPIGKSALMEFSALSVTTFRMVGAAACFWLLSAFCKYEHVDHRDMLKIFFASLFALVFNQGVYIFGLSMVYGSATELRATLDYDFSEEKKFSYRNLSMDEIIHHLAIFVSRLWQIHAFGEGNTRTTAVFFIKYLRTLGFDVTNDIFAENAWYFRNALVRANYNDLKNGIHETTEFLELFLRNLLLNEDHPLHNRSLHIRGLYGISKKANIDDPKANIESAKANIKNAFTVKTASHVCKLLDGFGFQTIFGRADVQKLLDLKPTRSTELLREMAEKEIIEPVSGYGKGKYRFKQQAV